MIADYLSQFYHVSPYVIIGVVGLYMCVREVQRALASRRAAREVRWGRQPREKDDE